MHLKLNEWRNKQCQQCYIPLSDPYSNKKFCSSACESVFHLPSPVNYKIKEISIIILLILCMAITILGYLGKK